MLRNRALPALLIAAVAGSAGGLLLTRLTSDDAGGRVILLGRTVSISGSPGTLVLAYPEDWDGNVGSVNCATADDVHASTDPVEFESLVVEIGSGRSCTPELDPRPMPGDGAYVSAAFFDIGRVDCGATLPTSPPASLQAMELDSPAAATLREYEAEDAYENVEWRHASWCVGGPYAVRLEVFLGNDADRETRELADVIVRALEFQPAPAPAPSGTSG